MMFSRRRMMSGALGLTMTSSVCTAAGVSGDGKRPAPRGVAPYVVETPADLTVDTDAGRVRGYSCAGIATFKGVPYGDCQARFRVPALPVPWKKVRTCFSYGATCPQTLPHLGNDVGRFYTPAEPSFADENCLNANVWTPGVAGTERRPVIVWLHGGGFNSGSSHESIAYDGENLSRRGNVVVVSFNHRLNALGFLNLSAYGARYSESANVGLLDLVLALRWVRATIDRFGGDPSNVTIMGQSGGGRKVSTLLAMPAARGLFHKAIIQSGSLLTVGSIEQTGKVAAATLQALNIADSEVGLLDSIPTATLIAAFDSACARLRTPASDVFNPPFTTPTLDGTVIPTEPFDTAAPAISSHVPLLVGSCLHEQAAGRADPDIVTMSQRDLQAAVAADYGDRTHEVISTFMSAHPSAEPYELLALIQSVAPRRINAVRQTELKAGLRQARVYNYQFAWRTPMLDRAPLAHHGSELPFVFFNIDRCAHQTGGGEEAQGLAAMISDAWINFARRGDPNSAELPQWPSATPDTLPTMIFDSNCAVRFDHDRAEREIATVIPSQLRHL